MLGARRPQAGQSKASAATLCQKCLKRDIYECVIPASERPYNARPSRTQQLANPRLKPKLSSDIPPEQSTHASLNKAGIADATLARREAERRTAASGSRSGRSRSRSSSVEHRRHNRSSGTKRKRPSPSLSSRSRSRSHSVSTISTNRSTSSARRMQDVTYPSQTAYAAGSQHDVAYPSQLDSQTMTGLSTGGLGIAHPVGPASSGSRKRRRGSSSSSNASSALSERRRSRSSSSDRSMSRERHRNVRKNAGGDDDVRERNTRRRRNNVSPDTRGRRRRGSRDVYERPRRRREAGGGRSRSGSRDRSDIARHRHSMTPDVESRVRGLRQSGEHVRPSPRSNGARDAPARASGRDGMRGVMWSGRDSRQPPPPSPPQRERSLSPFSKRKALTQAMKEGRA